MFVDAVLVALGKQVALFGKIFAVLFYIFDHQIFARELVVIRKVIDNSSMAQNTHEIITHFKVKLSTHSILNTN